MPRLETDCVDAGAVLEEPVLDASGRVLLQRGAILTAALLERLRGWQITTVVVVDASAGAKPDTDTTATAARSPTRGSYFDVYKDEENALDGEPAIIRQAFRLWAESRGRGGAPA